jgi:integrase
MAINIQNYLPISKNLKISKINKREFLFDFRIEGKRYRKVEIFPERTEWRKAEYVREAQSRLIEFRRKIELGTGSLGINTNTKLNELWELYYQTLDQSKSWTETKKSFYLRYLKEPLGKKSIGSIQEHHIIALIRKFQSQGMATRTINTALEILRPLFDFAIKTKALQDNPTRFIKLKKDNVKKIVINGTEMFKRIYDGITTYYKTNPFYCALFLFGFTGRRKSEILKLKWDNIDLENGYYWIEDTKNDEQQKYILPPFIKEYLLQIQSEHMGLVFKSPVTGKMLENIDRQMVKLKEFIQMPELTLHYMRNVLVSALAENGIEAITLSGILGHKDATTINKYLSLNYLTSSKKGLDTIDKIIDAEIEI